MNTIYPGEFDQNDDRFVLPQSVRDGSDGVGLLTCPLSRV
jgi:hypothetical protein